MYLQFMSKELAVLAHCLAHAGQTKASVIFLTLFLFISSTKLNVSAIYVQSRSFGCVAGGKLWLARWIVQLPYLSCAAPRYAAISL